jgi:NADH dehydrogenase
VESRDPRGAASEPERAESPVRRDPATEAAGGPLHVVVLGAGFAGLAAAKALTGDGAGAGAVEVTLVDRHVYSTFQPLLYQVATGGLHPGDVAYPIRGFAGRRGVRFLPRTVVGVDPAARKVHLADGTVLGYDFLVVATGADVNDFGVPGAGTYARALYTRREAIDLRDSLMGVLERTVAEGRRASVVVVGGGATGVEIAGTLAELAGALPAAFPGASPSSVRVILAEQATELLAPFAPRLRAYARRQLESRGVEVRFGTAIAEIRPDSVRLADGSSLPADLTIWAAGVKVPDELRAWGLHQGPGARILVGADLRVEGQERIFAAGDVALSSATPLPQLAQPAIQTGRHAGRQVLRLLEGLPTEPFRYRDKGTMATIGRRAAVVQLPFRVRLTGTVAWLAWLGLHIVSLLGNRNRASALLNLSWRYLYWPSGIIVGDIPDEEKA